MYILLTQVEALVNSRPLGVVPGTEFGYLSPLHFLFKRPYISVPEGNLIEVNADKLSYWKHIQYLFQDGGAGIKNI